MWILGEPWGEEVGDAWPEEWVNIWKRGCWSRGKIDALKLLYEGHVDGCVVEDCVMCESLLETWSQAEVEFSWQSDFLV